MASSSLSAFHNLLLYSHHHYRDCSHHTLAKNFVLNRAKLPTSLFLGSSLNYSSNSKITIQFSSEKHSITLSSSTRPLTVIAMDLPKAGGKAKKVTGIIKLALEAGKATTAPLVGPALGSKGVNIMAFCKDYNAQTADKAGYKIPVEITVYDDRSFTFILKTPPASDLLRKAAGVEKGSKDPKRDKVGKVTIDQLRNTRKSARFELLHNRIGN